MAKDLIYKRNGAFIYSGEIEPHMIQEASEIDDIPTSDNAQAAIILGTGDGLTVKMRLPGGNWTEV